MDQKRKQEMEKAGSYVVYLESEQADLDDHEHPFDAMWQSIYDVCKLVKFGIIDDIIIPSMKNFNIIVTDTKDNYNI